MSPKTVTHLPGLYNLRGEPGAVIFPHLPLIGGIFRGDELSRRQAVSKRLACLLFGQPVKEPPAAAGAASPLEKGDKMQAALVIQAHGRQTTPAAAVIIEA